MCSNRSSLESSTAFIEKSSNVNGRDATFTQRTTRTLHRLDEKINNAFVKSGLRPDRPARQSPAISQNPGYITLGY